MRPIALWDIGEQSIDLHASASLAPSIWGLSATPRPEPPHDGCSVRRGFFGEEHASPHRMTASAPEEDVETAPRQPRRSAARDED